MGTIQSICKILKLCNGKLLRKIAKLSPSSAEYTNQLSSPSEGITFGVGIILYLLHCMQNTVFIAFSILYLCN